MATPPPPSSALSAQQVEARLSEMMNWFENEPKLPDKIVPIVMLRFLKCMQYEIEPTKALIQLNYNLRNKNPNLFLDRDMDNEVTAKCLTVSDLLILPGVTPERHKLIMFRMTDYDPKTRNSMEETKLFFMMADARFTEPDVEKALKEDDHDDEDEDMRDASSCDENIADGDVQIVDMAGYTMRHIAYVSIFVLRVYMKFLQEAYPSRLRGLHIINCPSFLDRIMSVMKPFVREEIYQMVNYHTEGLDSLYEIVPREMLPIEYGGSAGTISELKQRGLKLLRDKSAYLSDEKYWKVSSEGKSRWSWF